MAAEHLFPILESTRALETLCEVVGFFARAEVPESVLPALRLGRMTALKKPSGGARGIVVSDVFRRLVAPTICQSWGGCHCTFPVCPQHLAGASASPTPPKSMTELDDSATLGVGAFDLVSRNATMQGLLSMEGGDKLPFIRQFYSSPSTLLWEDELAITNHIQQGERGEQFDPLMPLLFALAPHSVLVSVPERLQDGEFLFAFLTICLHIKSHRDRTVGTTARCC